MMLMPSNNSSATIHYWAGRYPGRIGWLFGPAATKKTKIRKWIPFALDNDAFAAWTNNSEWDCEAWRDMIRSIKRTGMEPLWLLVPDVVSDRDATIEKWGLHHEDASKTGWPLAFAVQDGMTVDDVPSGVDVVFVGGTTEWKWKTVPMWCSNFDRVHVGRVNSLRRLWTCEDLGVESVDGTGWFRDTEKGKRMVQIEQWLDGYRNKTAEMFTVQETQWRQPNGDRCGIENYQTLCVPCHKAKTAKLAKDRSEARRREKKEGA
jgi:hypothetical protein